MTGRRPLRRTPLLRVLGLAVVGFAVGRLTPELIVRADGTVPQISWLAAVLLLVAAVLEGGLAWSTWQSLHRKKQRMASAHALRLLAFAKAGITVGSVVAGFYAGFAAAYVDAWDIALGRDRVIHSGAAALAAVLLVIAALLLERACVIPTDGDDDDGKKPKRSTSTSPEPA